MKKKILALSAACALGLAAIAYTVSAQSTPTPTPPSTPGAPAHGQGRHFHPAIRAAIRALERAKADMQAASNDFGGHREQAITACDNAIAQLRLALQYANQNVPPSQAAPEQ